MLDLLSITVNPDYARRIWAHPGHTVFVDLEITGKRRRQAARDTVINVHSMDDAARLAALPGRGPLLVRTNAPAHGAADEAVALARLGVDRIMLPMFRTREEVDPVVEALDAVRGDLGPAAPTLTLLVETDAAVRGLETIVAPQPDWVDTVYLGLNDLSLDRGTGFLFAPVASGEVAELSARAKALGRRFGFGGVGMPDTEGPIPAAWILAEHVRVGSDAVILSRAFHAHVDPDDPESLSSGIERVRRWEARWQEAGEDELQATHRRLAEAIEALL